VQDGDLAAQGPHDLIVLMPEQTGDSGDKQPRRLTLTQDDFALEETPSAVSPGDVVVRLAGMLHDGQRIPVPRHGLEIGSTPGSDLALPAEDGVAESHAGIEPTPDGFVVVDRGSGLPTYVNGERLGRNERRPLSRGDAIAVGTHILHFLPPGGGSLALPAIEPEEAGRIRTDRDRFTIGRAAENDLVLDHPTVSLHHAVIRRDQDVTWIEDLGSTVGTRVNGIRLRRTALDAGDQIGVGPFRIVYDGDELIERSASKGLPIACAGVTVTAGNLTILKPTTLHIGAGELVAIIGESGAGKSTLLRALAGVSRPTAGTVLVGGEPVEARQSEIGYVPQFDIVHGKLTVREALTYSARIRLPVDFSVKEREHSVMRTLERLGVAERADVLVEMLSGGQRKRAAVGTELLHQPGVLFLDEPTTGLDPGFERKLMELFREIASSGQTVVLVTHATASISLCDRVVVMGRGGVLCYDGKTEDCCAAFGVSSFDEVYLALEQGHRERIRVEEETAQPPSPPLPPLSNRNRRAVIQPLSYQAAVLAERYALLLRRDKRHLKSALIQVPVLGLLTALLFAHGVFAHNPPHTGKSAQLLFLMVTVALWLGSINAAREIVKEREVFSRELAVGVRIPSYLVSKLVVLFAFSAVQVSLFALIVVAFQPLHESSTRAFLLWATLVITSWIAVLLGLLVSATAASQDQATAIIPLLLVPQLLLGGAIVTLKDMSVPIHALAELIPARWGFAEAGSAIHLQQRIQADPAFQQVSSYGNSFFTTSFPTFVVVMALFGVGLTLLLRHLLRPDSEPLLVIARRLVQQAMSGQLVRP